MGLPPPKEKVEKQNSHHLFPFRAKQPKTNKVYPFQYHSVTFDAYMCTKMNTV